MINRVYQQAKQSLLLNEVVVATDSAIIEDHCKNANMQVIMTSEHHQSGTDRVAEVAASSLADVVINIQGDEPFIPPTFIDRLCEQFSDQKTEIATLIAPIGNPDVMNNPNIVKVIRRTDGRALYFSRSVIPYHRNKNFEMNSYRHLGVYGFKRSILLELAALEQGNLERYEMLEQLRWLEAGYDISTAIVDSAPIGVDVPEDIERIMLYMEQNGLV